MSRFKVKVDKKGLDTAMGQVDLTINVAKEGTRKMAEDVRDLMREMFAKNTHNSVYGSVTPIGPASTDKQSLGNHGIVVSSARSGKTHYSVGPKKGSAYGLPYDTLLGIIAKGRSYDKPVTFRLPKHRESASHDGMWTVKKVPPNPYVDDTMRALKGGESSRMINKHIKRKLK